jgi:D-alanine--poly(phosphoribitol) ligase subunit 2
MQQDITTLIVNCVRELGSEQDLALPDNLDAETTLFGQNGLLDSLGLVSLVVNVEQAVEDAYGMSISLTDEKAMSQRNSPYRSISSLSSYIHGLMQDAA